MNQATSSFRPPNHISIHFTEQFTYIFFDQNSIQLPQPGRRTEFPTKTPSGSSSWGSFKNFHQSPLPIPQQGSISNFHQKNFPHCQARSQLKIPPGNLHVLSRAHIQLTPRQSSITIPELHTVYKITPEEPPSTHPTYHPSYSPTITTCTRPTPNPFHTWATPGRLCGHMGHTALVIKYGSHLRVQSYMQSCIQSCTRVKKRF